MPAHDPAPEFVGQWWQALMRSYAALGAPADALSKSSPLVDMGRPSANPYVAGLERTFGAVVDALGMGPSRAVADAWQALVRADQQKRAAGAQYVAVAARAWSEVPAGVMTELQLLGRRGERIDSFVAWVRLWSRVAEAKMHDAMQSPAGLEATAACVRAGAHHRQQQNRLVALVSEYHGIPTRSQLDDAYFEIQQLKRDVRALQRANRAPPQRAGSTAAPHREADPGRKRRANKRAKA
jgi:hypothetical protein